MSEEVIVRPVNDQTTIQLVTRAAEAMTRAQHLHVVTEEDEGAANALLVETARIIGELEKARKAVTAPVNALIKAFNAHYRTTSEPLEAVQRKLGQAVIGYRTRLVTEARAAEAAARAAEEEAAAKAADASDEQLEQVRLRRLFWSMARQARLAAQEVAVTARQPARTEIGGSVSTRRVRRWKIVDRDKVPREWMAPNELAINAAVRGGLPSIPGIEITEEDDVVVRR